MFGCQLGHWSKEGVSEGEQGRSDSGTTIQVGFGCVCACVRACVSVCVYQVSIPGVSRVPGECLLWIMCVPYLGMILYDR